MDEINNENRKILHVVMKPRKAKDMINLNEADSGCCRIDENLQESEAIFLIMNGTA